MSGAHEVIDLPQGGKSRTGHRYIHELSRPGADVLGFMDADIRLPEPGTLLGMIDELDARPELRAFTSRPVKDVDHFDMQVSPMTRMIAAGGGGLADYRNTICGQLFMLRAPAARRIGLPTGLPVEDGFIRAMVLTDLLSGPGSEGRIDGRDDLFHVYASIRDPGELIRHQTRIVVGGGINATLFGVIHREAPQEAEAHAFLMAAAADEDWLARTLKRELPRWPFGFIPFHFLAVRMRRGPQGRSLRAVAIWLVGCGFDVVVYGLASIRMLRGHGAHFW
jgi:hypothetical protein